VAERSSSAVPDVALRPIDYTVGLCCKKIRFASEEPSHKIEWVFTFTPTECANAFPCTRILISEKRYKWV
jgi:hypothetical protein